MQNNDLIWMQRALELARLGAAAGEVPVGAVLVLNNEVIGEAYNSPIADHDPSAHAEMLALRAGAKKTQNYRLINACLYVTLEPCIMCVGAMVHARIQRLVYAANDPKTGAIQSQARLLDETFLNHRVQYEGGVLGHECGKLLSDFFRERRAQQS
jgi:tRNA(adenine34) deaminase